VTAAVYTAAAFVEKIARPGTHHGALAIHTREWSRERNLSNESDDRAASGLQQRALRTPWDYIARSVSMIVLAVSPALVCAYFAQTSADWHLFERSGSIVTIAGLLLASRRYFEHTVTDLVVAHTREDARFEPTEVLSSILDARRGLTLSAFGTLIWGWGTILRWWSFAVLALWLAFVIYRAFYDPVLQYSGDDVSPVS
jgi:hypothetical protein